MVENRKHLFPDYPFNPPCDPRQQRQDMAGLFVTTTAPMRRRGISFVLRTRYRVSTYGDDPARQSGLRAMLPSTVSRNVTALITCIPRGRRSHFRDPLWRKCCNSHCPHRTLTPQKIPRFPALPMKDRSRALAMLYRIMPVAGSMMRWLQVRDACADTGNVSWDRLGP